LDRESLKARIQKAFDGIEYSGDWCLRGSNEGDEPFQVEEEFRGKTDWRVLDAEFLDRDSSALSFFSDEAFRFYLPAYLTADIDGLLQSASPVFHLTHGLSDESKTTPVNPRRYGARTWFESTRHRLAVLDQTQAAAVVSYLEYKRRTDEWEQPVIDQALANFWRPRAMGRND
jgi:hypothetical protein